MCLRHFASGSESYPVLRLRIPSVLVLKYMMMMI